MKNFFGSKAATKSLFFETVYTKNKILVSHNNKA